MNQQCIVELKAEKSHLGLDDNEAGAQTSDTAVTYDIRSRYIVRSNHLRPHCAEWTYSLLWPVMTGREAKQPVPEQARQPPTDRSTVTTSTLLFLSQASRVIPDDHPVGAAPRHGNATENDPQPD